MLSASAPACLAGVWRVALWHCLPSVAGLSRAHQCVLQKSGADSVVLFAYSESKPPAAAELSCRGLPGAAPGSCGVFYQLSTGRKYSTILPDNCEAFPVSQR